MTYEEMKHEALGCFSSSEWLKKAIKELERRDILDAFKDVEFLAVMLNKKWQNILDMEKANEKIQNTV